MDEYIEREALLNEAKKRAQAFSVALIYEAIKEAPACDVVEVIRCSECQHWGGVVFGNVCKRWSAPLAGMKNCTKPDDFCSYGERKADENAENI